MFALSLHHIFELSLQRTSCCVWICCHILIESGVNRILRRVFIHCPLSVSLSLAYLRLSHGLSSQCPMCSNRYLRRRFVHVLCGAYKHGQWSCKPRENFAERQRQAQRSCRDACRQGHIWHHCQNCLKSCLKSCPRIPPRYL